MADVVLFQGGPLDGEEWIPYEDARVVRISQPGAGADLIYTFTGTYTDTGCRVYEWEDNVA